MGLVTRSKTYVAGEVLKSADLNTSIDEIVNVVNGNIDSSNLASDSVGTLEIQNTAVTKGKLGTMEYVVAFTYPGGLTSSAENLRQIMFPYAGTLTKIEAISLAECTAFALDVGKAAINSSSIGSSFFTAGSASVTASGTVLSITGASLANTTITANTKFILSAKSVTSNNAGKVLVNLFVDV